MKRKLTVHCNDGRPRLRMGGGGLEQDWRRSIGGGLEEDWRMIGGGLEEDWRMIEG